jgi:diguanylate cyclase (GGDEF)-like protein
MATILIVDTNATDRRPFVTLLGNFGHRLLEAGSVSDALQSARNELPDLIIADITLPDQVGFILMRQVRADPLLSATPIVFFTTDYNQSEIHRLAHSSGVQHILKKPAEPQEILRAVNETLGRKTTPARLRQTGQLKREQLEELADKLYQKVSHLEKANERLHNISLTDSLSGMNNRRGFMVLGTGLLKFARRAGYSTCLIYLDLDSLKLINDKFGHTEGDKAIAQFSRILIGTFRESDVLGRLGGDEFVALIIDATREDLIAMQSRLQTNVESYNRQTTDGYELSFSMGGIWVDAKSTITMEELLVRADEAMYKHKVSRKRAAAA